MDDLLTGAETVESLVKIKAEVCFILERGGFNLRKLMSNEPAIVACDINSNLSIAGDIDQSTLGIVWNPASDLFKYAICELNDKLTITKRTILSPASKVFDPLGLLSPITVVAKLIIQILWQLKLSWDESVPLDLQTSWRKLCGHLPEINKFGVNRRVIYIS